MITYYKTVDGLLQVVPAPEPNCWIAVTSPSQEEQRFLREELEIPPEYIESSLDPKERSRVERYKGQDLMVLNVPVERKVHTKDPVLRSRFYTLPFGFIVQKDRLITITLVDTPMLQNLAAFPASLEKLDTYQPLQLAFSIAYEIASHFTLRLGEIDTIAFEVQNSIYKTMKNEELLKLLGLQKSLVLFSTSLRSTESTLEKLIQNRNFPLTDEEQDLLEDTLIEVKQSIQTADIYADMLSSTMDAVSSMISNNMNIVMKILTSLTIVLSIPNMVFGFYGMNVALPHSHATFLTPMLITLLVTTLSALLLYLNGFFK